MTPDQVEAAAQLLLAVRGDFRTLQALPPELRPETLDDGYAIQDAFARAWGLDVGGWKLACTASEQQAFLGVDGPFSGRIFAPYLSDSPAELSAGAFHMRGIEGEFAFRLGEDLPPRETDYTAEDVANAVAAVHPAIEIVDSRYEDWLAVGAPSVAADNAANGALVIGPETTAWRAFDLPNHSVEVAVDGDVVGAGTGARALGSPLTALTWLANQRSRRGDGLKAGQVVTTGTCTGIHFVDAGARIEADFGDLGAVSIKFTD